MFKLLTLQFHVYTLASSDQYKVISTFVITSQNLVLQSSLRDHLKYKDQCKYKWVGLYLP